MVIWLIGLSGAGKTTIGKVLVSKLRNMDIKTIYLDGDELREVWGDSLGHNIEGRSKNAHRISNLCKLLEKNDVVVVASVLSLFPEWQKWNRENFNKYFEVFIDVPMSILEKRDSKGLYKKARNGEIKDVVGIDIPFPEPTSPDLIIDNSKEDGDIEGFADRIMLEINQPEV